MHCSWWFRLVEENIWKVLHSQYVRILHVLNVFQRVDIMQTMLQAQVPDHKIKEGITKGI